MTVEVTNEPDYMQETLSRYRFKIIWDKTKMSPEGIADYGEDGTEIKNQVENFIASSSFTATMSLEGRKDTDTHSEWTIQLRGRRDDLRSLEKRYTNTDLGLSLEVL